MNQQQDKELAALVAAVVRASAYDMEAMAASAEEEEAVATLGDCLQVELAAVATEDDRC